jgi:hypothetical protein
MQFRLHRDIQIAAPCAWVGRHRCHCGGGIPGRGGYSRAAGWNSGCGAVYVYCSACAQFRIHPCTRARGFRAPYSRHGCGRGYNNSYAYSLTRPRPCLQNFCRPRNLGQAACQYCKTIIPARSSSIIIKHIHSVCEPFVHNTYIYIYILQERRLPERATPSKRRNSKRSLTSTNRCGSPQSDRQLCFGSTAQL